MYPQKTRKNGPIQRFKMGRVCKKFGCKQRLSIYNPDEFCNIHSKELMR